MKDMTVQEKKNLHWFAASLMVIVLEGRGGVGKSTIAQALYIAMSVFDETVYLTETDTTNSSMSKIGKSTGELISVNVENFEGGFYEVVEMIKNKKFRHGIVDCGARDEAVILPILDIISGKMRDIGGHLVIVRPITTSHFVQTNAMNFVKNYKKPDMACLFVRNRSQGRISSDFDRWLRTKSHTFAKESGVIEIEIKSLGVVAADNAMSFGMSFADVAEGKFEVAGKHEVVARDLFSLRIRLSVAEWLREHISLFRGALAAAVSQCTK